MKNIFKVLSLVLVLTTMFTLSSCKKENVDFIVGTWDLTAASYEDEFTDYMYQTAVNNSYFEFKKNGTLNYKLELYMISSEGKTRYSISDNQIIISDGDTEELFSGVATYKQISDGKLVLNYTDDTTNEPVTVEITRR